MLPRAAEVELVAIQRDVVACRRCPRLARYVDGIRREHADWWCRPVPSFGDAHARILAVGLAPGRAGSNRTGRMFTGDGSGNFLYPVLHEVGLASQPTATTAGDGMTLRDLYITAVGRCAPPQNRPTPDELLRCRAFLARELRCLPDVRVIVSLGKIAHDHSLHILGERPSKYPFRHGAEYCVDIGDSKQGATAAQNRPSVLLSARAITLLSSYHPSRQNTQTGVLTRQMFLRVFRRAVELADACAVRA